MRLLISGSQKPLRVNEHLALDSKPVKVRRRLGRVLNRVAEIPIF